MRPRVATLLTTYAALCASLTQQIDSAYPFIDRQRRTLGSLLGYALDHQLWDHAQAIAQPLYTYLVARGLDKEADAWDDRMLPAIEDPCGSPPGPENPAYNLWVFLASSHAKRLLTKGRLDDAERSYHRLREVLQNQPPSPLRQRHLAVTSYTLGLVAQSRGRLDEAQEWYRESLVIHEQLGDRPGMAISYHHLGSNAKDRGQLDKAQEWCLKSLTIAEEISDRPTMVYNYNELSSVAQHRGRLDEAEQWYLKGLAISEDLGARASMAVFYNKLGSVAQHRGWLDEAEQWYLKSLTISEEFGETSMIASYGNLGVVAHIQGRLIDAQEWYLKSLTLSEEFGDKPDMASAMTNLGLLAEALGNHYEALKQMVRCVALFDEFPHPATGTGPDNLARLAAQLGMHAVETCWHEVTGNPIPQAVRNYVDSHRPQTTQGPRMEPPLNAPVRVAARAAATRLNAEYGPGLAADV